MIYLASATVAAGTTSLPRRAIPPSAPDGPERWLQLRIMENPAILLAGAASPKHARVRSMSCEVVLPGGRRIDWIGISPEGEIVLSEVKLGANGHSKREIVAQALDYYSALRRMSYESLQEACQQATFTAISTDKGLFEAAGAGDSDYTAEAFAERVADNLRTGTVLLVLALDHVPGSLARLVSDVLMDQPALPFSVSLVEIGLYNEPGGGILLAPVLRASVLTTTRAVVRVEGSLSVEPLAVGSEAAAEASRPAKRSMNAFLALLDRSGQGLAAKLAAFLENAAQIGVQADVARSMVLRLGGINVGSIGANGVVQVYITNAAREADVNAFWAYMKELGEATGATPKPDGAASEPTLRCALLTLLDRNADWLVALSTYGDAIALDLVEAGKAP
jgi:hypothetical protein